MAGIDQNGIESGWWDICELKRGELMHLGL